MSVSFNDFLESANAKVLLNNPDNKEIDFRNLISRSYYAMFHLSKEVAKTLPLVPTEQYKKSGSHEKIFIKFEKNSDKNLQRLAEIMYKIKDNRVKADYHLNLSIKCSIAKSHFYAVEGAIKKLQQLKTTT